MLGIEFLKEEVSLQFSRGGLEFMDKVNSKLYPKLVEYLRPLIKEVGKDVKLEWVDIDREALSHLIMAETGILIDVKFDPYVSNAGVDGGYFKPDHIFNNEGIEEVLTAKHSSIGNAFKSLKTDVLRGYADPNTGRVGGDFSKVEFSLWIQELLNSWMDIKLLKKLNLSNAEGLAAVLCHEMGHIWTGFYFIQRNSIDMVIPMVASKLYMAAKTDEERYVILKDTNKVLEISDTVDKKAPEVLQDAEAVLVYFNKQIGSRDTRRTLSLGLHTRTSEIYADLYAIKMGAGKAIVAALGARVTMVPNWLYFALMGGSMAILAGPLAPTLIGVAAYTIVFSSVMKVAEIAINLVPGLDYDTPYRRAKSVLRDYASRISSDKDLRGADKAKLLKDAKELEKYIEEQKPLLEGTAFQRLYGWLGSGSDFKAQEFEHYTQEVMSHNLAFYIDHFKKEEE